MQIISKDQFVYCQLCGKKTDKKEVSVGKFKSNLVVECPEHGELML